MLKQISIGFLIWVLWTNSTLMESKGGGGYSGNGRFEYSDGFDTKMECERAAEKINKENSVREKKAMKEKAVWYSFVYAKCRPAGVQP